MVLQSGISLIIVNESQLLWHLLELFQPEIFCHDENFLPMLIWAQNLCAFPNDQDSKVSIEKTKKIISVANNVPSLTSCSKCLNNSWSHLLDGGQKPVYLSN